MSLLSNKIKLLNIITILSFFSLSIAASVCAETYYVDTGGSDSTGKGTLASPWKSVSHALSKVGYGALVSINDGTYSESPLVVPTGVSLTSTAQDNTKVKIQPNDSLGLTPLLSLTAEPGTNGNQSISYIELSGLNGAKQYAKVGIKILNRNNVTVDHCYIHDFKGGSGSFGIYAKGTDADGNYDWTTHWPTDPQDPGNDKNLDAVWPDNPVEGLKISYNTMENNAYNFDGTGKSLTNSIYIKHLKNSSIHHNTIDSLGTPIGQATGILWNVDIYNNNLTMPNYSDRSSYSIELWDFRNGCEIFNNKANAAFSLAYGKELKVYNNTINAGYKGGLGIEVTGQSHLQVYRNYIEGSSYGIVAGLSSVQQSRNFIVNEVLIRNNVIYDVKKSAIFVEAIGSNFSSNTNTVKNVDIWNNVLDTNRNWAEGYSLLRIEQKDGDTGYGVMQNIDVSNNVIMRARNDEHGPESAGKIIGKVSNLIVDHNIIFNNGKDDIVGYSETNTVLTNPNFETLGSNFEGYTPQSPSDAIDGGKDVGLPYSGDGPDIGANETGKILEPPILMIVGSN